MTYRHSVIAATTLALLTGSALAQAPATPNEAPMMPMVEQTTENPMVPVADATHIAHLGRADSGDVLATAWLRLDPQNNTLDWTIEYEGAGEITTASLLCPAPDANMPEPEGNGVGVGTEGMVEAVNLTANSETAGTPLEGVAADLPQATFAALQDQSCAISIITSNDGDNGPVTGRIDVFTDQAAGGVDNGAPGAAPAGAAPAAPAGAAPAGGM